MRRTRSSFGFTVTELLFILAMMGVASLLSARLFTASMKIVRTAPQTQDYFANVDRMSSELRRDVWGATQIETPDEHTLVLTTADATQVRWVMTDDAVSRSSSGNEQRWTLGTALTVNRQGPAVVLKNPAGDELRFVSQPLFGGGTQ